MYIIQNLGRSQCWCSHFCVAECIASPLQIDSFHQPSVQYSAKRWRLGCVNSPSRPEGARTRDTQLSLHLSAEYCKCNTASGVARGLHGSSIITHRCSPSLLPFYCLRKGLLGSRGCGSSLANNCTGSTTQGDLAGFNVVWKWYYSESLLISEKYIPNSISASHILHSHSVTKSPNCNNLKFLFDA